MLTGDLIECLVGPICQYADFPCQSLQPSSRIEAQKNLHAGEPVFESKLQSNPESFTLSFKRYFR